MKRFNRLRRIARKIAKENGHELTTFKTTEIAFSIPGERFICDKTMFDGPLWYMAKCIHCNENVFFSENLSPNLDKNKFFNLSNVPPTNPFFSVRAVKNCHLLSKNNKKDFPEKSKGVIYGSKILEKECKQKK